MFAFVALYGEADDPDAFDEYYRTNHVPIAASWPNLRDYQVLRLTGTPRGGTPRYHHLFVGTFDSREDFLEAMASESGQKAQQDVRDMAERFDLDVQMLLGEPASSGT